MRKYQVPVSGSDKGVEVPSELLEKIADDVRAFDKALTPEVRSSQALDKIASQLNAWRERWEIAAGEVAQQRADANELARVQAIIAYYALPVEARAELENVAFVKHWLFLNYNIGDGS